MKTEQLLEEMKTERNLALGLTEVMANLVLSVDGELKEALEDLDDLEEELVETYMKIEELELAYQNMEAQYARLLAVYLTN